MYIGSTCLTIAEYVLMEGHAALSSTQVQSGCEVQVGPGLVSQARVSRQAISLYTSFFASQCCSQQSHNIAQATE